jgi:hypothetical protein
LPQLSKIILGTMRLDSERYPLDHWVDLFRQAHLLGVTRLHCSDEYESFPFLLRILEVLRMESPQIRFDFIVKLAEPSFDLHEFSEHRFFEYLERYRELLVVDRIDTAQWMWRGDLANHEERIEEFRHQSASIAAAVDLAKLSGRLGSFFCFPYSHSFASSVLGNDSVDGLAIYRNPREGVYDDLMEECESSGRSVLVIRPFSAGEALGGAEPETLIRHSAGLPAVTGIIVSCGSVEHLEECVRAAAQG